MNTKIGVLGGGQLGRMLGLVSPRLGIELHFLDSDPSFPAGQISPNFTTGNFKDKNDVYQFGKAMDAVTIEIENVSTDGLRMLEADGIKVYPQSHVIDTIKDKGLQKEFYKKHNLASSEFTLFNNAAEIRSSIENGTTSIPFVQKARTDGYDGKGVQIIKTEQDLSKLFDVPSVVEQLVDIKKELAVIVARDLNGKSEVFTVVEMEFDAEANLLDKLICPARVSDEIAEKCITLATSVANKFEIIGLLAVELFLTENDDILINEVAPRTHNSGHHTIENNFVSQFEQHLRCVAGQAVAKTEMICPAAMVNILGESQSIGAVKYEGLEQVLSIPKVYPHLYGKAMVKPFRKMGHITILADELDTAIDNANFVKQTFKASNYE